MLLLENGILDERINSDREIARELCTTNGISARNLGPCNSISRAICRVNGISVMNSFILVIFNIRININNIYNKLINNNYEIHFAREDLSFSHLCYYKHGLTGFRWHKDLHRGRHCVPEWGSSLKRELSRCSILS